MTNQQIEAMSNQFIEIKKQLDRIESKLLCLERYIVPYEVQIQNQYNPFKGSGSQ